MNNELPQGYEQRPWDYHGQLYIESQMRQLKDEIRLRALDIVADWMLADCRESLDDMLKERL